MTDYIKLSDCYVVLHQDGFSLIPIHEVKDSNPLLTIGEENNVIC